MAGEQEYLARLPFFAGLREDFIVFLGDCAQRTQIAPNHLLFRHGEDAQHFYAVLSGTIVVEVPAISGPTLEVQRIGAAHMLGWSWLIPPYKWDFNARAETDAETLEFDGVRIRERCDSDHEFGYQILLRFSALMSERLHAARQTMIDQWNPPGFA